MSLSHSPSIVTSGLVVYLDAANSKSYPGSGTTWTDLTGNGWNGTLTAGPTYSSVNGGTIVLDGSDDYVALGTLLAATAAGTISFWIKFTNTITTGYAGNQRPWGKNNNFEARWGGNAGEENRKLYADIIGTGNIVSAQNEWSNAIWYNCTHTWDSSVNQSSLYIQGVLDASGTAGDPSALTGAFNVGATTTPVGFVNGQMSSWMYYNRRLTASEVLQNFNALRGRYGL